MAAQYFYCNQCHERFPTRQKLFDTLYEFSRGSAQSCPACGGTRELRLTLDFQLGAGDGEFTAVSALLPEKLQSWLGEEEEEVTLYPFLVLLKNSEGKQFCWMPYWHVTGKEARYGQHALCLESAQFDSLRAQLEDKILEPA